MGKMLAEEAAPRVAQEPETQKNKEGLLEPQLEPTNPLGPVPDLCCSGKYNRGPPHSQHIPVEPIKSPRPISPMRTLAVSWRPLEESGTLFKITLRAPGCPPKFSGETLLLNTHN